MHYYNVRTDCRLFARYGNANRIVSKHQLTYHCEYALAIKNISDFPTGEKN